jgi:hypothetical protein
MTELDTLTRALDTALARPNPLVRITEQTGTARQMIAQGATHRRDRYGCGGAWVGYDYHAADGRLVAQSMAACGNPH